MKKLDEFKKLVKKSIENTKEIDKSTLNYSSINIRLEEILYNNKSKLWDSIIDLFKFWITLATTFFASTLIFDSLRSKLIVSIIFIVILLIVFILLIILRYFTIIKSTKSIIVAELEKETINTIHIVEEQLRVFKNIKLILVDNKITNRKDKKSISRSKEHIDSTINNLKETLKKYKSWLKEYKNK